MAAKGVNLLPEDDDGQDNDEPEDEYEDNLDELVSSRSRRSRHGVGGVFFRAVGIVLAIVIFFGGAAWAGYQFWWVPRLEKEQKKVEARKRLENLRKRRLEQAKVERGRGKKELALLQKIRAEAEEKTAESTGQKSEKKKSDEASLKTAQRKDDSKKAATALKPPVAAIKKAQIRVAKEIPQKKAAPKKAKEK